MKDEDTKTFSGADGGLTSKAKQGPVLREGGINPFHRNLAQTHKLPQPGQQLNPFGFDDDDEMMMSVDEGKSSNFSRISEGGPNYFRNKQQFSSNNLHNIKPLSQTIGSGVQTGRPSILQEEDNARIVPRRSEVLQETPDSRLFQRAQDHNSNNSGSNNHPKRLNLDESSSSEFSRDQNHDLGNVEVQYQLGQRQSIYDGNGPPNTVNHIISGRSSKLFDVASQQNLINGKSLLKINDIKDLMRLFRVNLNEDGSFEFNGQPYVLDLEEMKQKAPKQQHIDKNDINSDSHQISTTFPQSSSQGQGQEGAISADNYRATFGNIVQQVQQHQKQIQFVDKKFENLNEIQSQGFGRESKIALDRWLLEDQRPPQNKSRVNAINHFQLPLQSVGRVDVDDLRLQSYEIILQKYQNGMLIDQEIQVKETDFSPNINQSFSNESFFMGPNHPELAKQGSFAQSAHSIFSKPPLQKSHSSISNFQKPSDYDYQRVQAQLAHDIAKEEENQMYDLISDSDPHLYALAKTVYLGKNSSNQRSSREDFKNDILKNSSNQRQNLNIASSLMSSKSFNDMLNPPLKRNLSMGDDQTLDLQREVSNLFQQIQKSHLDKVQVLEQQNLELQKKLETKCQGNHHHEFGSREPPHLVFLFATPLVVQKGSRAINPLFKDQYKPQALLEFKREFKEIKRSLKETGKHIRIQSLQATVDNFTMVLGQKPLAMHFTGHGIQYQTSAGTYKKLLLLEMIDGESIEITEEQLTELIKNTNVQLDFVFVASCNSEFAGRIFQKIGVKHVIVVKQGNNIADEAVIVFSKTFYGVVFQGTNTVCASFLIAKNVVEVKFGRREAEKFTILTHTDLINEKQKEDTLKRASIAQITQIPTKPVKKGKNKKFNNMPDIELDDEFNIQLDPTMFGFQAPKIVEKPNLNEQCQDLPPVQSNSDPFKQKEHECHIFGPFEKGSFETLDEEPFFKEIPSYVENFIGRQVEQFEVIHNIMKHRLVNIMGLPGIGKTALAKNAVHYILDRRLFKLGIIFISCKGYKNSAVFMKKLVSNIIINNMDLNPEQKAKISDGNYETLTTMIINFFKKQDDQLLVVFDNAEELIYYDKKEFRKLVTDLLEKCPSMKFLMTSRVLLGSLQDIQEKIVLLQELEPKYAIQLFKSRSRQLNDQEILELIKYQPLDKVLVDVEGILDKEQLITSLEKHHLFQILAGNPHAIILAAPLLHKKSLKELYMLLNSPNLTENLAVDGVTDSTVASFVRSLEVSVSILQQEDQYALQFFYLIGLLPGGISEDELKEIWKKQGEADKGCEEHIKTLMNLSLLQLKEQAGDRKQSKLILPPFINNYAEQTIDPQLKTRFQTMLCHHYSKILQEIFREDFKLWVKESLKQQANTSPADDSSPRPENPDFKQLEQAFIKEQRKKMIKHETNIWACIYRMSNTELPIQFDQIELDQSILGKKKQPQNRRRSYMQTPTQKSLGQFKIKQMRKSSDNETMLDSMMKLENYHKLERSKSVNNPVPELLKIGSKLEQQDDKSDSTEEQKSNFIANEEEDQNNQEDFSKVLQRHTLQNGGMLTIPEEEVQDSSSLKSSSIKDEIEENDGFEHVKIPKEMGSSPGIIEEAQKAVKNKLLQKLVNPIKDMLKSVERNSIVIFKRSSTILPQVFSGSLGKIIEDKEQQKTAKQQEDLESQIYIPQPYRSSDDNLPFFSALQPLMSTPDQVYQKPFKTMTDPEKLIVYYSMILFLHKDYDNALKLINRFAIDIQGSIIYTANIQRIRGLIQLNKLEINEAMEAFKKAEDLYKMENSMYGRALCQYSIGVILQSQFSSLLTSSPQNKSTQSDTLSTTFNALRHFDKALDLFEDTLNHKVGMSLCHEHLASLYKTLGNTQQADEHVEKKLSLHSQYSRYLEKQRNHCPYVSRQTTQDMALMTEVVKDNENRDLFPEVSSQSNMGNISFKLEKLKSKQHSNNDAFKKYHSTALYQSLSAPDCQQKHQSFNQATGYSPLGQSLSPPQNVFQQNTSPNQKIQQYESNTLQSPLAQLLHIDKHKSVSNKQLHVVPEEVYTEQPPNKRLEAISPHRGGGDVLGLTKLASADRKYEEKQTGFIDHIFGRSKNKLTQSTEFKKESGPKSPIITDSNKSKFSSFGQIGINLFKKLGDAASNVRQRKNTM